MAILDKQKDLSNKNDDLEDSLTECTTKASGKAKELDEKKQELASKEEELQNILSSKKDLEEALATKKEKINKLIKRLKKLKADAKKSTAAEDDEETDADTKDESKKAKKSNKGKNKKPSDDEENDDDIEEEEDENDLSKLKKVVAFGLYGGNPKYTHGAIENVKKAKEFFPGWICRFYIDDSVPNDILDKLKAYDNTEIIKNTDIKGSIAGMFWRFLVAADPTVDVYIIRDSDSRLGEREKHAIDDWLATKENAGFHVMRDHPSHTAYSMSGGMWGGREKIPDMLELINAWNDKQNYVADMHFLGQIIWERIKNNVVQHDSFSCVKWGARPFPDPRVGTRHVGQVYDANNVPRAGDIPLLEAQLPEPIECQPESQKNPKKL
eukprot:TRINITY_DN518_c2_g1_i1.p1 TRINITY_DN518_c2_g1~~TRINITY_DN518_c2_g1_i1.p1  ORF type:complete len:382 (+),score=149.93 TRINITY_DN518_c2_g1_i1:1030-2175(+)